MNQLLIEILFQCRRIVEVAAGMKLNLSKLDQVKMKYNSFGLGDSFATMDFADFIFFAAIANLVIESWRKFQNKRESKQKKICLNTECKETVKETKQIKIFFLSESTQVSHSSEKIFASSSEMWPWSLFTLMG